MENISAVTNTEPLGMSDLFEECEGCQRTNCNTAGQGCWAKIKAREDREDGALKKLGLRIAVC